jgi:large subunit ribosomal protein L2
LKGSQYIRSAGTYGKIIHHTENEVLVKLPSKKLKYFSKYCMSTIGRSSNVLHFLKNLGKAGINRYLNVRPTVRGETMNPIDHPLGGRTRGGKPTKNP